jgi:hypothetical protein
MTTPTDLAKTLGVEPEMLEDLNEVMSEKIGRSDILQKLIDENRMLIDTTLEVLDPKHKLADEVREVLRKKILRHEEQLKEFIDGLEGRDEFERGVAFAKSVTSVKRGFFLKKEIAEKILRERPPENVLKHMGASSIEDLLKGQDVTEVFSSLRFLESDEWMHETFDKAYSNFTEDDFEERDIEVKVLGPEWQEVAKKFVAKKHHNVSHLKEFGVIFLNPIKEDVPGKFLRDTALFLHYFHEISFYSKLFKKALEGDNFGERFKALLRGDVPKTGKLEKAEWLIVQQYLWKKDPEDPRLFVPHVNPESMHWARGERDLTYFAALEPKIDLEGWHDLDWVAGLFEEKNGEESIISFDLEDNTMTLASFMEGENKVFHYHQQEAMWTKLFLEYAGGEEKMEKLLIENFDKGKIKF